MPWLQNYDPLGLPWLSTLVAALPVLVLLGLLASGRVAAALAAFVGLVVALVTAIAVFAPENAAPDVDGRPPWAVTMLAAAGNGAAFGLFPIGWIVLSAIFFYSLTVHAGRFEIVKSSVVGLSPDRRIQALLIAFSFGAFLEGAAGFGTPVAISAALMMGAGFRPLYAAVLALIANTSPVAFGALGTPIVTLARVTGIDATTLSMMAGRQLPFFSLLVPAWLVWVMAGFRATLQIWPAILVAGGSFAIVQFLVSNFHGPELVDVGGGVVSLVSLTLLLRVWQPRTVWRFPEEMNPGVETQRYSRRQIAGAWAPWVLLTAFVFVWGLPQFQKLTGTTIQTFAVPALDRQVARHHPVADRSEPEAANYKFDWLSATGTAILFAAVLSAFGMRIPPVRIGIIFLATCYRMRWPLFTIACMLAIAYTTRFSGMDATLGLAFTKTGVLYPFFAALLGWLGVALTGSDTSANALFGNLQTITGRQLVSQGVLPLTEEQAMVLLATANSTGGVMGKMIDAQSIVVSTAATNQSGQEGAILRWVFPHSVALAILMGLLVLFQAFVWTAAIP